MKTAEDLKQFFDNDLQSDILGLEKKRKGIVLKLFVMHTVIASAVVAFSIFIINSGLTIGWIFLVAVIFAVIAGVMHYDLVNNKDFYIQFKTKVIDRIVKYIDGSFIYLPHKYIPPALFMESHMFSHKPTKKFKGDDYVIGKLGDDAKIEFSELLAQYKPKLAEGEKATKKKLEPRNLFKGLFFVATLNKNLPCEVVILPHHVDRSGNPHLKEFVFGSTDFRERFRVFTNNAELAEKFIAGDLENRIVEHVRKSKNELSVSFVGNRIFVAVAHQKDLFEPKIFHTLMDFDIIKEYFDDLEQALTIVEKIRTAGTGDKASTLASANV
jgi:hypothetical protein